MGVAGRGRLRVRACVDRHAGRRVGRGAAVAGPAQRLRRSEPGGHADQPAVQRRRHARRAAGFWQERRLVGPLSRLLVPDAAGRDRGLDHPRRLCPARRRSRSSLQACPPPRPLAAGGRPAARASTSARSARAGWLVLVLALVVGTVGGTSASASVRCSPRSCRSPVSPPTRAATLLATFLTSIVGSPPTRSSKSSTAARSPLSAARRLDRSRRLRGQLFWRPAPEPAPRGVDQAPAGAHRVRRRRALRPDRGQRAARATGARSDDIARLSRRSSRQSLRLIRPSMNSNRSPPRTSIRSPLGWVPGSSTPRPRGRRRSSGGRRRSRCPGSRRTATGCRS